MSTGAIHKKDNVAGLVTSAGSLILLLLLLKVITYTQINPRPLEEILKTEKAPEIKEEIVMQKFETSAKKAGGSGRPTDAPLSNQNTPQMDKTIRDPNSTSNDYAAKGESNHTNTDKSSDNQASTLDKSLGFSKNSGGKGGGDNGGRGNGFGGDAGDANGPGKNGGEKPRVRLNNPNTSKLNFDYSCKITLKMSINAEGKVVSASNVSGKTTTTDQSFINKFIALVKDEVRFSKKTGASVEIVTETFSISAI